MKPTKRKWWLISISGYGSLGFYGTAAEAEEMRVHKSNWERGVGRKFVITATHTKAKEAQERAKLQLRNGCTLDERELESIGR